MFRRVIFLLLTVLVSQLSVAQVFSGRIIAEDSTSISYSTIYSREAGIGITADGNGLFSVQIPVGKYRFEISALGFEARTIDVNIDEDGYDCTVILREQVYRLKEVTITGDNNAAYRVMRNVLASAGRNRRLIAAYSVTNYAKGTGRITKLPELFRLSDDFARDSAKLCGSAYVMEGVYDINYKYPDNYNTVIKAFKSSFPIEIPVQIWNPSDVDFYSDYIGGGISLLGRNAFSTYNFKLEGYYMNDEGRMINKIRIIPKGKSSTTFTGHIYIVEDLWCLSDADLYISNSMYSINLIVNAKEMRNGVFLPATSSLKANASIMGMKFSFGLFSCSNYSDIDVTEVDLKNSNSIVEVSNTITNDKKKERAEKIEYKIAEIMADGELTTQKAIKVFKLNDKLSKLQITDTLKGAERYNLDLRAVRKRNVLDGAMTRDSFYWASVRLAPLTDEEALSYKKFEERKMQKDSVKKISAFELLIGHKFYNRNGKLWIKSPGLDKILYDINAVDGFNIGVDIELGAKFGNNRGVSLRPWGYYLTHRKSVNFGSEFKFDYAPAINGRMSVSVGRETADYNGTRGYRRYLNMLSTFMFGDNYAKFYDNKFIHFDNSIDIANGLNFTVEVEYTIRSVLNNTINKFGKKQFESNIPVSENYRSMPDNSMLHFSGILKYTPACFFRYIDGRKVYIKSNYPTFTASYAHGFEVDNETAMNSLYNKIEFGISHKVNFVMSNLNYWVNAGIFMDSRNVYFPDFHHVPVNPFYLSFDDDKNRFILPGNYEYSTSDKWVSCGASYKTGRILLNFIPFLDKPLNTESIGFRTVAVKGLPIFNEIEYCYNNMDAISIGVAVAFRGNKYAGIGFTVGMPITKTLYSRY